MEASGGSDHSFGVPFSDVDPIAGVGVAVLLTGVKPDEWVAAGLGGVTEALTGVNRGVDGREPRVARPLAAVAVVFGCG